MNKKSAVKRRKNRKSVKKWAERALDSISHSKEKFIILFSPLSGLEPQQTTGITSGFSSGEPLKA